MPFLEVKHLTCTIDSHIILNNISMTAGKGEYIALIGANGSGKTTLVRHLKGLMTPAAGSARVQGVVGMVFQDPEDQVIAAAVEDDVAFGPENLGVGLQGSDGLRSRVEWALQMTGMAEYAQASPYELSAGQQQRVAIAGALAMQPECLILDEATSMLDPRARADVLAVLEQLHQQGMTIITVTHSMEEALRADRVVVLHQGQVAAEGKPAEVLQRPELKNWGLRRPWAAETAAELRQLLEAAGWAGRQSAAAGSFETLFKDFFARPPSVERLADLIAALKRMSQHPLQPAFRPGGVKVIPRNKYIHNEPEGNNQAAVEFENLSHFYANGRRSLDTLTGAVITRQVTALAGETGSGKSTLLHHLAGLILPQAGKVRVLDIDLAGGVDLTGGISAGRGRSKKTGRGGEVRKRLRGRVGLLFQRPEDQLFERYAGDDVAFGPRQMGVAGRELVEVARRAMEMCGLNFRAYKDREIVTLSGGERRKTALAGVLALRPELLLLDEPTAGLDPVSRAEVAGIIAKLPEQGTTVLFSTHDMDLAASIADCALVLNAGRLEFSGPVRELFPRPNLMQSLGLETPQAYRLLHLISGNGDGGVQGSVSQGNMANIQQPEIAARYLAQLIQGT